MATNNLYLLRPERKPDPAAARARWQSGIPERRDTAFRGGVKLIVNHAHVALVLRVKAEREGCDGG